MVQATHSIDIDTTGEGLAEQLQLWRDALQSSHRGEARPAYAVAGLPWIKEVSGSIWEVYLAGNESDGSADAKLATFNPEMGALTVNPAGLVPATRIVATGEGLSGGGALSGDLELALVYADQAEAEGGVENTKPMTAERVAQAIAAQAGGAAGPLTFSYGARIAINGSDPDHDIDFAAGRVYDETGALAMNTTGAMTKRADAAFAAGGNQGGMVSGESLPASGTVHLWRIMKADGTVDHCFNNHAASGYTPALPTGFVYKQRLASLRTDASSNFRAVDQVGPFFYYRDPVTDLSGTTSTSVGNIGVSVPPNCIGLFSGVIDGTSGGTLTHAYRTNGVDGTPDYATARFSFGSPGAGNLGGGGFIVPVDGSSQIRLDSDDGSRPQYIGTHGWIDFGLLF